jgi:hypothetical protein
MRYYLEHVEHALHRQQEDQKLPDGQVIKHAWPWAWGALKRLKARWIDLSPSKDLNLLGPEWVGIETDQGLYKVRAVSHAKSPDGAPDYQFEVQEVPSNSGPAA